LKIPSKETIDIEPDISAPTNTYVVEVGDTLYSIAQNNNISTNELINLNNLTNYELYAGQILKLPTFAGEEIINENEYVVQRGDSLYAIARTYGTTVDELKRLNNLSSNELQIGQILKISGTPTNNENVSITTNYVVQKGDTLYSIARRYDTTVNELKNLNNLSSNTLDIGQTLRIPN